MTSSCRFAPIIAASVLALSWSVATAQLAGPDQRHLPGDVARTNSPNEWKTVQYEQACTAAKNGTGAAATFTPLCPFSYVTVDTAGQTILLPVAPPPAMATTYTLDITYSANGATPQFSPATKWQNGTAPVACGGGVTVGCLSAAVGATDRIIGQIDPVRGLVYGAVITNYGAAPSQWHLVAHSACSGSGCTTAAVNTSGTATNGPANLIVIAEQCATASGFTPTDSVGSAYTPVGTYQTASGIGTQLFYVASPTTNAAHTFTVAAGCLTGFLEVQAWSGALVSAPLDQQNGFGGSTTASTIQPGSITTTQANELVVSAVMAGVVTTPTIDSGMTISDSFGSAGSYLGAAAYLAPQTAAGAINPKWGWTGTSATGATVQASFKAQVP